MGLADGDVLLVGVDDPQCGGHAGHVGDTTQDALELGALAGQHEDFLLGAALVAVLGRVHRLQFLHAVQTLGDGLEVGEHAAQPTVVDEGHADALGLGGHSFLGLLLRADEEDGAAVGDGLLDELVGLIDVGQRLLQIDDVDAVTVGENEALHFRVPTAGLVSEVDTGVEKLAHGHNCHGDAPFLCSEFRFLIVRVLSRTLATDTRPLTRASSPV